MTTDGPTARRNAVLAGLTDAELAGLLPHLEEVPLPRGQVLIEPGRPVGSVHFPTVGVVSLVHELERGDVVEIATVGREGMTGLSVFLGAAEPYERAIVQISGHALRMTTGEFQQQLTIVDGPLQASLRRYTQAMFTQLGRNAACNRVHRVQQRAARWLLLSADRMQSNTFDLTQEFLAQMLAVRRASVSQVAQALADAGCISYTRGSITILDEEKLHAHACQCYDVITRATEQAMSLGDPARSRHGSPAR
ncbi:Crp/Fnr family transcriptional regulator [Jatrophihabitans sp.]|uniref:Crp/Fnr family transcriptional regulator n=1 Tax=Jatrophihabitans sp. TaxID=1932789 RepID=UPI002EDFAB7D